LRKTSKHKVSKSHVNAQKIVDKGKKRVIDEKLFEMSISEYKQTQRVFRNTYFISKVQRP
jgi:hypothetical protein